MKESIVVQNLKCGGCAHTITTKLSKLEGVSHVSVDIERSIVEIDYDVDILKTSLSNTLTEIGYPPVGEKNNMITKAKSVFSCATGKLSSE